MSGNGQTYINGKPGIDECKLNENDILEVGNSEYMFIPFCKKHIYLANKFLIIKAMEAFANYLAGA